jgi:hypothetical protein
MLHRWRALAALGIACLASSPNFAGPTEDSAVGAFDFFCLGHLDDLAVIGPLLGDVGALKLDAQTARPFLAGHQGHAWMMKDQAARLLVTVTNDGSCGTYGPDAAAPDAERLFIANSRSRLLRSEPIGTEDQSFYAVTHSHPKGRADIHAVVVVGKSRLASVQGVWFTAIPEKLLAREGIRVPTWP